MPHLLADTTEDFTDVDGVRCAVVSDLGELAPFLLTMVSDTDHWCFISTTGALTAGRRDADGAVLPYETDDRLHRAAGTNGPATTIRVDGADGVRGWHPFGRCPDPSNRRAIAKSVLGDIVVLEEVNDRAGLAFRCRWATSDEHGLVRRVELANLTDRVQTVTLTDGLIGLLPHGIPTEMHATTSNLTNAYRRSELLDGSLSLHTLEALIVDRAEPAEALRATTTWSLGPVIDDEVLRPTSVAPVVTLDPSALELTPDIQPGAGVRLRTGRPGAHLLHTELTLPAGATATWYIVADGAMEHAAVARLRRQLLDTPVADLIVQVEAAIASGSQALSDLLARADGRQATADEAATAHHLSNTLFNSMRGGVFADGMTVTTDDLRRLLHERNREVANRHQHWMDALPPRLERDDLLERAARREDPDLHRLVLQHLPVTFSRRHGDPSRPWNRFSIRLRTADGAPARRYEGNWRDIFQNWEALCESFPAYLPGVIATFVNASTVDGFNPYRVMREGIDWEVLDPDDAWSNIGYWGDHQIVYLLRLLEACDRWLPGTIDGLLGQRLFTYADVPYRLASYDDIVADPRNTISYDQLAADAAAERIDRIGGDGALLHDAHGRPLRVTLLEKLLVPALTKLSAYVPDGGLWLHTQRPEWNDANNALVGYGLSMVTLCHLRRYLRWLADLPGRCRGDVLAVSPEVAIWLDELTGALASRSALASRAADPDERAVFMDALGRSFGRYRATAYAHGLSEPVDMPVSVITGLVDQALPHLDGTIRRAMRDDGLIHTYNLLHLREDGGHATLGHLPVMLEGQVAVLSAGVLDPPASADLLDALRRSALHRPDQDSYLLYPADLPSSFMSKNVVPAPIVEANPLLVALRDAGRSDVIGVDADGAHRFGPDLRNGGALAGVLDHLAENRSWSDLVTAHRDDVLAVYEHVFDHHSFTGRSSSMHAYEGLGSIYWHMVGKLLVATQDAVLDARHHGDDAQVAQLRDAYQRIRDGLGFTKTAQVYGAFPTDAYSHTPAHAGAQQPGMTGQVKEELLTRRGELGVWVAEGRLRIDPVLFDPGELLVDPVSWSVLDVHGNERTVDLQPGELGLTVCQVPVIVAVANSSGAADGRLEAQLADGEVRVFDGLALDPATTWEIARRSGEVQQLRATIPSNRRSAAGDR